jgi:hypothetical protein
MSNETGAHDPSALVRRGHLPFADSAKGRKAFNYIWSVETNLVLR